MEGVKERICDSCSKTVPVSDLRYVAKGKDLLVALCPECRVKKITNPETKTAQKPASQKREFFCTLCRYKFKLDPTTKSRLVCPFCGRTHGVQEHKELSSDALLSMDEE